MKWRPLSISELTPMIYNTDLTHLGSEAFKYGGKKNKFASKKICINVLKP